MAFTVEDAKAMIHQIVTTLHVCVWILEHVHIFSFRGS